MLILIRTISYRILPFSLEPKCFLFFLFLGFGVSLDSDFSFPDFSTWGTKANAAFWIFLLNFSLAVNGRWLPVGIVLVWYEESENNGCGAEWDSSKRFHIIGKLAKETESILGAPSLLISHDAIGLPSLLLLNFHRKPNVRQPLPEFKSTV